MLGVAITCSVLVGCSSPGQGEGSASGSTAVVEMTTTRPAAAATPGGCRPAALTESTEPVEIVVWHALRGANEAALRVLTERFVERSPLVRVRLERQPDADTLVERWRAAPADARPTLALAPEFELRRMVDSKRIVPIHECLDVVGASLDEMLPIVRATYSLDGRLQAMPFTVSTPVLVYNRTRFRLAGIDPERPPATLIELRATAEALRRVAGSGPPFVVDSGSGNGGSWYVEQWLARTGGLLVDGGNGRDTTAQHVVFAVPAVAEWLAHLRSMITDGLAVSVGPNHTGMDGFVRFIDPAAPSSMAIHSSGALVELLELVEGGSFPSIEVGVGPIPGPGRGAQVSGAAWWLGQDPDERRVAAGWAFAQFLSSASSQAQLAARTGYVPVRSSATADPVLVAAWARWPHLRVAYDQLATTPISHATAGAAVGPRREIRTAIATSVASVFAGGDPTVALSHAVTSSDHLIAAYRETLGGG